jgi:DNA-binding MarR family transcriptional regulator
MDTPHPLVALIDEIGRTRGRLRSAFQGLETTLGLTDMEMTVLNAVAGARAAPTTPQIGRSLGHPRQVIQRTAHALAERGLIALAENPDHRRASLLRPTAAGLALKQRADAEGWAIAESLCDGLDAAQVREIAEGLHAIRLVIEENLRSKEGSR